MGGFWGMKKWVGYRGASTTHLGVVLGSFTATSGSQPHGAEGEECERGRLRHRTGDGCYSIGDRHRRIVVVTSNGMYITTPDPIKDESRNGLSNGVITCEI